MTQSKISNPEISVLMSVYNESAYAINIAVESILNQTFSNYELIIVNDNPTSVDTQKILNTLSIKDSRIKIITNDRNRGLGYSLNAAIKSSKADLLARMDTEDSSLPERLIKQISYMKENPKVDLLFTQWIDVNEHNKTVLRKPNKIDFARIHNSFFIKSLLMHPTLIARKAVLLANPYPEMGRPEDIVLWLQLIRKGYIFDLIEEPLYRYRVDRINITRRYNKIKKGSTNLLPHLIRESRYYWSNLYFWFYFSRTFFEFMASQHILIYKLIYTRAVRIWKAIFGN